jgi:predicted metallopeptidase
MGNTEKVYSRVTEAEEIVKGLCAKQPEVLWCVQPAMVAVLGIENKERSEKNKTLAKIKAIKGGEKAILQLNNIPARYIIEIYWSDWREWSDRKKQWIIFHELLHVHNEIGRLIKHDSEDFKILLDKVGVSWTETKDLPDLLNDKVEFNLELRPSLEDVEEGTEGIDNIEDAEVAEEKKARKNSKKAKKGTEKADDKPKDEAVEETETPEATEDTKDEDGDVF